MKCDTGNPYCKADVEAMSAHGARLNEEFLAEQILPRSETCFRCRNNKKVWSLMAVAGFKQNFKLNTGVETMACLGLKLLYRCEPCGSEVPELLALV